MSRAEAMKNYGPEYFRTSRLIVSILDAEGAELDQVLTNIEDVLKQFYVETATDWGLSLWEQMLGLKSFTGKPEDQRRSRIISKLRGVGTVTIALIKNVAESYTYGTVEVTEHPDQYSFTIKYTHPYGTPPNIDDVRAAIEEIKPAHLEVVYEFSYMTWDEHDAYNKTWNQWDALNLTWDDKEVYREVV